MVLFFAINTVVGCSSGPDSPEEAFDIWLGYQEKEDYKEAWDMITVDLQNRRGIRGFHVGMLQAGWRGELEEFVEDKGLYAFGDESGDTMDLISRVENWQTEVSGEKAVFSSVVPYKGFDWHLEFVLIVDSDRWKVSDFSAMGHLPPGSDMMWIE